MFYIIERKYVGPNQTDAQYCDSHLVLIQSVPGRTNSSHEERTEGWLGTTNDWAEHAHGEYETLGAARAAVEEKFGKCRESDLVWEDEDTAVELYRVGEYEAMSREATSYWIHEGLRLDVTAETTDERLEELIAEYEAAANDEGCTLDSDAIDMAREYRDELRDAESDA